MRQALARLQEALREGTWDAVFIAAPETLSSTNLRYLSGFTGSSASLLVSQDRAWIITDFRYLDQAAHECSDFEVVEQTKPMGQVLGELCVEHRIQRLGFEADKVPVAMWEGWRAMVPVVWRPLEGLVEHLRLVKSAGEIAILRRAAEIASSALLAVLPGIVGRREDEVALDLEMAMRARGAESLGFSTIVASGPRGALPHGHPTDRVIMPGELATIDFGAQFEGYKSDETVTVATGEISDELRQIFDLVANAQQAGIEMAKPGATSREVDRAAREIIESAGYGDAFGHGTGHGVGLDVHEEPYASKSPAQETVLEPGMTLTVEPGIYLSGIGGVRLEDTLVITESGSERLTTVPKTFRVIGPQ